LIDGPSGNTLVAGVRTLVVTLSPLLADLVASVLRPHLPLDVIGVLHTHEGLAEKLRELRPELILLGLENGEKDSCARPLLAVLPSARILVLTKNGQHAWLYKMRPHRTALVDVSPPSLIGALSALFQDFSTQG
jgi:DNA-binding NarL/FixJ family response regulator